jgi:ATP-binding cassette subfamily F protein uup
VRTLSGGERNRLLLARLFARPANVLVLDEPTNDLDIDTLELLEDLLQQYEGTVFLVSHDRRFLDNVVTSTLVAEGEGLWREYVGDVQDWLTQSARSSQAAQAAATKPAPAAGKPSTAPAASPSAARRKLSYKEQRELDTLPAELAALEAEQATLEATLADGSVYASDPALAGRTAERLAALEERWLAAMERLEALKNG